MRWIVLATLATACTSSPGDPQWYASDPASIQVDGSLSGTFYPPDVGNSRTVTMCGAGDATHMPTVIEVTTDPGHDCASGLPSCPCDGATVPCYVLTAAEQTAPETWTLHSPGDGSSSNETLQLHGSTLSYVDDIAPLGPMDGGEWQYWTYTGSGCTESLVATRCARPDCQ